MLFSVIVPVYNGAQYLVACLESIIGQTETAWECLCVDDGSTDGAGAILDEYAARDSRFKVFHKQNEGVSVARNTALNIAQGDYVCFVDADDVVDKAWLSEYQKAIAESGADLIRCGGRRGRVEAENLHDWLWQTFVKDGYPWKYALKRTIAQAADFPVGVVMSEDALYNARVMPLINSAFELGASHYRHIVREGSAMFRPLASAERLVFLTAWLELVGARRDVDRAVVSHFVSDGVLAWLSRPRDVARRDEIRQVWRQLHKAGFVCLNSADALFRFSYASYAFTGLIWPTTVWSNFLTILVRIKGAAKRLAGVRKGK